MFWNIRINFGIPSEDDVVGMEQSLESTVESYDFGDIDKKLDQFGNHYVVNDIRVHMIIKFAVFLQFVKEETQFAEDGFILNLEGLNENEVRFWTDFQKSVDEGVIKDFKVEAVVSSDEDV